MSEKIENCAENITRTDKPLVSIIVAISLNNAIGRNNQLLWHISEDLKYFKSVTSGHTIIMGRKTWESLGRPLPNRRNIVISRTQSRGIKGAEVFSSIEDALAACMGEQELFIIGGGEIYKQTLPIADKLYLTIVSQNVENADTFFPYIDFAQWNEFERDSLHYGERILLVKKS